MSSLSGYKVSKRSLKIFSSDDKSSFLRKCITGDCLINSNLINSQLVLFMYLDELLLNQKPAKQGG